MSTINKNLFYREAIITDKVLREAISNRINQGKNFNQKVKIDTGKFCNARCYFCYYLDRVKERDFLTLEEVLDSTFIGTLLQKGIRKFEFSGGEPTLCWDLGEIINYIRYLAENAYKIDPEELHFSIVTNGFILRDKYKTISNRDRGEYIITPAEYQYIEEILFSLHGHKELHESITKINGSYDKIVNFIDEWIEGLDELEGIKDPMSHQSTYVKRIRINVVVGPTTFNNSKESRMFQTMLTGYILKGIQVNLLPLNSWDNASVIEEYDYHKIIESINDFISRVYSGKGMYKFNYPKRVELRKLNEKYQKENGANIINIRYIEPCKLNNEARNLVVNHFDHFFDELDWNKILYPYDAYDSSGKKNNYKFNQDIPSIYDDNIKPFNDLKKVFFWDASLSHEPDTICSNCSDFKNLRCDGLKYKNQATKELHPESQNYNALRILYTKFNRAERKISNANNTRTNTR